MDPIAIQILADELHKDASVLAGAAARAREHFAEPSTGRLAAAGFELNRLYNVLEKSFERICEAFENHLEKRGDYHEKLIERMQLGLTGIRPAFLDERSLRPVRELKGFRHLFRHAYELELDSTRIDALIIHAETVASAFPEWRAQFLRDVRAMHGL
jgi:hypothetical protein